MDEKGGKTKMIRYHLKIFQIIIQRLNSPNNWIVDEKCTGIGNRAAIAHHGDELDLGDFCIKNSDVKYAKALNDIAKKMNCILDHNNISNTIACKIREQITTDLLETIPSLVRIKSKCRIQIYGSFENGLCCWESDINFHFECNCVDAHSHLIKVVNQISNIGFGSEYESFNHAELVTTNSEYSLKLLHKNTRIETVISFNNLLRFQNAALMRLYLNLNANLKPLILYIKHILVLHDLYGYDKITSYQLFWFVTFLMQRKNLLPTVKAVRSAVITKHYIDGKWNCAVPSHYTKFKSHTFSETPASLFLSFVGLYKDFDFLRYVISAYMGCAIPIHKFDSVIVSNDESFQHVYAKPQFVKNVANLQDPTILNRNLLDSVRSETINSFKLLCRQLHYHYNNSILFGLGNIEINLPISLPLHSPIDFIQFTSITLNDEILSDLERLNRYMILTIRIMMENLLKFTLVNITQTVEIKPYGYCPIVYFDYCLDSKKYDTTTPFNIVPEYFVTKQMKMYIVCEIYHNGKILLLMEGTTGLINFIDAYGHTLLQHILAQIKLNF